MVKRTNYESGEGNSYVGFEVHDTDYGEVCFKEQFHQDGSSAKALSRWLEQDLTFVAVDVAVEEGGNILAHEDDVLEEMWRYQDSTEPEYTGNEGASRETTYSTCILIAFSTDSVFERECSSDFSSALQKVQKNPRLLDRALKFLTESSHNLSSREFAILHSVIQGQSAFWSSFATILKALSKNRSQSPSSRVMSILVSMIKEHGWNDEKMAPVRLVIEQLSEIGKQTSCLGLLLLVETLSLIKDLVQDKSPIHCHLQKTISNFDKASGSMKRQFSPYEIVFSSPDDGETYKRLETLSKVHGWKSLSSAAKSCFARIRKMNTTSRSLETMTDQIATLNSIYANIPSGDIDHSLDDSMLDAFTLLVKSVDAYDITSMDNFLTIHSFFKTKAAYWPSFKILCESLQVLKRFPSSTIRSIFVATIKEHGWNDEKVIPIRMFVQQLPGMGEKVDCNGLLTSIEHFHLIMKVSEEKATLKSLIRKTISTFEAKTEKCCPLSNSYGSRPYYGSYHRRYDECESQKEISNRLETLSKAYGWENLSSAANACFARMRKMSPTGTLLNTLKEQIAATHQFSTNIPDADIGNLRESILNAFLDAIKHTSAWESADIGILLKELCMHGTPQMFRTLEAWSSTVPLSTLSKADSALRRMTSASIISKHTEAKDKCIAHVHERVRDLKIQELEKQENDLLCHTHNGGPPVFSWRMPLAKSGSDRLDAFLRSDRANACEICVGGGIGHARSLARSGDSTSKGFSAHIRETHKTGKTASVIVTKSRKLYEQQVKQYPSTAKKLANMRAKLAKLNHRRVPPVREEPPAKRAKGPNEKEVIVIV